ncbi:MAG: hypothetical protein RIR48_1438, partial [Bacteroidota bacterium]
GNLSEVCRRTIFYRSITLDSLNCPRNLDGIDLPYLSCDDTYPKLANGYPHPSFTGFPFIDSDPSASIGTVLGMINNNNSICKINVSYSDTKLDICSQSYKILRAWSMLDWCTGRVKSCNQVIKILDDTAPIITEKDVRVPSFYCKDLDDAAEILNADPYSCTATWNIDFEKYFEIISECDTTITYTVEFKSLPFDDPRICDPAPASELPFVTKDGATEVLGTPGVLDKTGKYKTRPINHRIVNLPLGRTWVAIYVKDGCGNEATDVFEIEVVDKTPPVAVCDEYTVVTLTNNGFARVFAETFDDGSHDNCTPVGFQVSRMNSENCELRQDVSTVYPLNPASHTQPGRYVDFCCRDMSRTEVDFNGDGKFDSGYVQVVLTVWDDANLDGQFGPPFANPNCPDNSNTCMVVIKVEDKIPPFIKCPANKTIACGADTSLLASERPVFSAVALSTPYFTDNCGATMSYSNSGKLDNCGQGVITRTFTVRDDGGRVASCTQTITIRNMNPYTGPSWTTVPDRSLTGCKTADTHPDKTGYPTLGATACSQVAYTYEDQEFPFVDDVCFKILRKWTVIDWCKFAPNLDPQGREYSRTPFPAVPTSIENIPVNDRWRINTWTHTQIIKVTDIEKPVLANPSPVLEAFTRNDCTRYDTLRNSATDCTPNDKLKWSYTIRRNNSTDSIFRTGTTNDASGIFPVGTYHISWKVEDQCGNESVSDYTFAVPDNKKPTPYCLSQLTTVVMPSNGEVEIWARDFDRGSFDNCPGTLRFSSVPRFPNVRNDSVWRFTCNDFQGRNKIDTVLRMYVWDASGNFDFCDVTLTIQKNTACAGSSSPRIAGDVSTDRNQMIKDVQVTLQHLESQETASVMTDQSGRFEFGSMKEGQGYKILPGKNDDHLNGVSTLDLVIMQRHILDIEKLNSSYKYIAADVNKDNRITAGDLIELRKLILGIYSSLPNNTSWRFFDKSAPAPDINNLLNVKEYITIQNVNSAYLNNHFLGVKTGDLNGSAVVNVNGNITENRNKALTFNIDEREFMPGQKVRVDFTSENFTNISGAQWTLNFDAASLELSDIVSGVLSLGADNVNTLSANKGKISFSWNDFKGLTVGENKVLFSIEFRATANNTIYNTVSMSSDITKAEAYTTDLGEAKMNLNIRTPKTGDKIFSLEQNNPNPFTTNTTISFNLPEAGPATLIIYDITGKVLKSFTKEYEKGRNDVIINSEEINAQGVMFYELESKGIKVTKKMIYLSK